MESERHMADRSKRITPTAMAVIAKALTNAVPTGTHLVRNEVGNLAIRRVRGRSLRHPATRS
jgi:hypothetical protein